MWLVFSGAIAVVPLLISLILPSFIFEPSYSDRNIKESYDNKRVVELPYNTETGKYASIAIFNDSYGHNVDRSDPRTVIIAIWADGLIVWSEDKISGGHPYFYNNLLENDVNVLSSKLVEAGIHKDIYTSRSGPDADYTKISMLYKDHNITWESWHDLFENNPNLVATNHGIESLEGRSREEVLSSQPEEYQDFRKTWDKLKTVIYQSIPETGQPFDESKLEIRRL